MTLLVKILIDIFIVAAIVLDCDMAFPLKNNADWWGWLNSAGSILMYITLIFFGVFIWFI